MTSDQRPVAYEVTLEVEPELADAVCRELIEHHIPAILATGCFRAIRLERAENGRIRTRYEAATRADLDRYLAEHTARFRAEFMSRFPTGVRPTRGFWHEVEAWDRDSAPAPRQ
jgi:hypothetical protein